ncbi:MAG: GNAT family N-acetyltransferase [Pseudomonadota bacterium]
MVPELLTDRLRLRPWRLDDFEPLAAFLGDSELAQYRAPVADRFEAWKHMCGQSGQWSIRGYGIFAVALRDTDQPIGYSGLYHPIIFDEPELSWSLFAGHHGQGYATEMATAVCRWAANDLMRPPLMSIVHPDNIASIRVAERLGAKPEGETVYLDAPRIVYRHRDWRAS